MPLNNGLNTPVLRNPVFYHGFFVVFVTWASLFFTRAISVAIFFKPMLEEFRLDRASLSLVQTVIMLVFAVASPFLGRLIDRFGPRIIMLVSLTAQSASSVVNGLATGITHLYIGRLLSELRPLHGTQVIVNRWFLKKRGIALGISGTGVPLGMLILSPLSQYLVDIWGWRETLFFWAAFTFIIMAPLLLLLRDNPSDRGYAPDGEPLGLADKAKVSNARPDLPEPVPAPGGSLTEAARTTSFWLLATTHLICGIGCGFMTTHIVIFATDFGYSTMIGASLISIQGATNLVGLLITGHLSDRGSRSRVLSLAHLIRSISFLGVIIFIMLSGSPLWLLYLAMVMFGLGFFTTSPLASGLVADLFGNLHLGTLIGVILSGHMIGMAIGAYAGGLIFESTGSYYLFFLIQAILEFMAAAFAFSIKPSSSNSRH